MGRPPVRKVFKQFLTIFIVLSFVYNFSVLFHDSSKSSHTTTLTVTRSKARNFSYFCSSFGTQNTPKTVRIVIANVLLLWQAQRLLLSTRSGEVNTQCVWVKFEVSEFRSKSTASKRTVRAPEMECSGEVWLVVSDYSISQLKREMIGL